ncbi:MAG: CPBP family intramembrane glutamic endopeptidase [Gordonibacter sp.]|uniref:CPBP family intramembrane glutamic endopeptidase n=1 Tax=Gordonibacter sp. TaxID=1968902 RepID=UPI002FCA58A6
MNLPETRSRHPLAFVALATLVAVACFTAIPANSLELVGIQTALAASCMVVLLVTAEPDVLSQRFRRPFAEPACETRCVRKTFVFVTGVLFANGLFVGIVTALSITGKLPGEAMQVSAGPAFAPLGSIALFLAVCVATGVFEEGLFRGVISRGFSDALRIEGRKSPALTGAIASAFVFGVLHTANAPVAEFAGEVVVAQLVAKTVQATLFGFVMSAVLSHTGSLWTVVLLHIGFNILSMGPAFALTGELPSTYATGDPVDLAVLLISAAFFVPLAVHAWRILAHAVPPRTR